MHKYATQSVFNESLAVIRIISNFAAR